MILSALFRWLGIKKNVFKNDYQRRQSVFLGVFLLLCLALESFYLISNVALDLFFWQPDTLSQHLVENFPFIGLLLVLLFLNRLGFVHQSAYAFILFCLCVIPLKIQIEWVPYSLLFYVMPVIAASFVFQPKASLPVAILCIFSYLALCEKTQYSFHVSEWLFLGLLIILAIASWFVSDLLEKTLSESRQAEQKYLALLEKNPFCVYEAECSQAGRWTYLSPRMLDLLGYTPAEWLAESGQWLKRVYAEDRQRILTEIAHSLTFGVPFHAEYRMIHHSGRIVWISDDAVPTRLEEQPDRVQGVLLDITARKWAEQVQSATYRISQVAFTTDDLNELYRKIHEALGELMHAENFFIALYDPDSDRIDFKYFVDQYDEPPAPAIARHGLTEYILRTGKALYATREVYLELIAQGEITSTGFPPVDWLGVPLMINNRAIGVMAVQSYTEDLHFSEEEQDILVFVSTQVAMVIERKRSEQDLRNMHQLTSEVISNVNTGIIVYDGEARHLIWNGYMEQITGLQKEMVLGRPAGDIFPFFHESNLTELLDQALLGNTVPIPDTEYTVSLTGKTGWLAGSCGPHRDAQGKIIGTIVVLNEITERKQAEEALRSALSEKEVLLREIHHRVKNNLQVVSSLISLQSEAVQDPIIQGHFQEMQVRVRSMALIHEELYQSNDLSRVDFAEYISKLINGLAQTYMIHPNVNLQADVEEVFLGVDTAIPCGLIVNELVTNAFKYAFPDARAGEVIVRLHTLDTGGYRLIVCDNGIGLPPDIDLENTETLGMQLITILTRQLRGSLRIESTRGTCFTIEFREVRKGYPSQSLLYDPA
jgi:PAS domain S-box-containing protein